MTSRRSFRANYTAAASVDFMMFGYLHEPSAKVYAADFCFRVSDIGSRHHRAAFRQSSLSGRPRHATVRACSPMAVWPFLLPARL